MKYANHIILIILWTFIINAVLGNLALDAKSIMAGEWVELYLYKTGGHVPMLGQESDAVYDKMLQFIKEHL